MVAKNPFKVTDLVAKYGWQFLGYLANLGVNLPGNAQVLFVDSNATNATDADDTEHGHSFFKPLATLDYAIGLCTDGQGDVILIAPGHTETLVAATSCVVDKSDLTIVGLGIGMNRPTFSLGTDVGATISLTSANVTIKNIRIISALADITAGITAAAGADGLWVEDCDLRDGGTSILELIIGISIATTANDVTIRGCNFQTVASGGCASAIKTIGTSNNLHIENCDAYGTYSVSAFDLDAGACLNIRIKNCSANNLGAAAVEFHASSTGHMSECYIGGTTDVASALTGETLVFCYENYVNGNYAESGTINPAVE